MKEALDAARRAQRAVRFWPQERIDRAVAALAWHVLEPTALRPLIELTVAESGLGVVEDSIIRVRQRLHGTLCDLHGQVTLGMIEELPERHIQKFAKPVGVVAVLAPATAPVSAIVVNALNVIKTRNAMIVCANPAARRTSLRTVELLRLALSAVGAPEDLIQVVARPDRESAEALTQAADLVIATGGAATVERARRGGRPVYAGGPGNAVVIIDETADIARIVPDIVDGKVFDNSTSCSGESCLVVANAVRAKVAVELRRAGAHLCDADEAARLRAAVWPEGRLAREVVGKAASVIARHAGIAIDGQARLLVAELDAERPIGDPLAGEKLSPVLAIAGFDRFEQAVALTARLTEAVGHGHSCGIHTARAERVAMLAEAVEVARVMVNQSTGFGNSGSFRNGMPFSTTISCGTWGGGTLSENVGWRHFLNYTWVSRPYDRPVPSLDKLLAAYAAG